MKILLQHRFSFSIECNSTSISPEASSLCENPRFDAVALLRGEIFVFKNEYVWRLSEDFQIQPGYPIRFNEIFQDIPSYVRRIDAAYERKSDGAIILFHGRKYWVIIIYSPSNQRLVFICTIHLQNFCCLFACLFRFMMDTL